MRERHRIFETIMTENLSDTKPKIQKAQRTLSRINAKRTTPRCIIFKNQKTEDEEKSHLSIEEQKIPWGKKYLVYRRAKIIILSSFSSETTQTRRE